MKAETGRAASSPRHHDEHKRRTGCDTPRLSAEMMTVAGCVASSPRSLRLVTLYNYCGVVQKVRSERAYVTVITHEIPSRKKRWPRQPPSSACLLRYIAIPTQPLLCPDLLTGTFETPYCVLYVQRSFLPPLNVWHAALYLPRR
jgi:hypothetical protein